jgi:two-component system nitrate/nitrite response regulator NarL
MRLVVCDGNRILGEALAEILSARGHQVLAITTTGADGVAAVADHQPEVCILDLRAPNPADGLQAARAIRQQQPSTAVLILSGLADPAAWSEVRRIGAAGFLRKDCNVSQVADALDVILAGGVVFDPTMPHIAGAHSAARRARNVPYVLTPREKEVLRRIVAGESTGQMAREMEIATSTLRTYIKNLLTKLGAHSRLQAAALASRENLLSEPASA